MRSVSINMQPRCAGAARSYWLRYVSQCCLHFLALHVFASAASRTMQAAMPDVFSVPGAPVHCRCTQLLA